MRRGKTVTQRDIAERTGVSINTVSKALRGCPDISERMRERIRETAEELGYINNVLAGSLRSGLTNTVAVILSDISNPHFAVIVKEIVESLRPYRYNAFIMTTNEDEELELEAIRAAIGRRVDGVILCPVQRSSGNAAFLQESGIPFVLIGRYFSDIDTSYVVCDDELGGYQAAKHLLQYEHTDILLLNGASYISSSREREAGYRRALAEYGLPVREELLFNIPVMGDYEAALEGIFASGAAFTAVIAFSDMLAWELMVFLRAKEIDVPRDMSVIAFDDLQSRYVLPFQLASVTSSKGKMSQISAEILMRAIERRGAPNEHVVLPTKHVVLPTKVMARSSCFYPREK